MTEVKNPVPLPREEVEAIRKELQTVSYLLGPHVAMDWLESAHPELAEQLRNDPRVKAQGLFDKHRRPIEGFEKVKG